MKSRAPVLALAAAALLLHPSKVAADKPEYEIHSGGVFERLSNCPEADYAILTFCDCPD